MHVAHYLELEAIAGRTRLYSPAGIGDSDQDSIKGCLLIGLHIYGGDATNRCFQFAYSFNSPEARHSTPSLLQEARYD